MSSNPPGTCCYKGVKHEGDPVGKIEKLDDFEVYISEAPDKSTEYGILIITDVIGHRFNNAQLIADQFAQNGYFVFMPELFYGDPIPLNRPGDFDLQKWLKGGYSKSGKPHTPEVVDPIIEKSIKEMRTKYGCKKIGAVGYCFGAKYVVRYLRPGEIDVGYCAHPSFVEDDELKAIKGPFAISAAETDMIFPNEKRHHTEDLLKEIGQPYQINLYAGVEHGFAVRADLSVKKIKYAKESAFLQALQWFDEYLNLRADYALLTQVVGFYSEALGRKHEVIQLQTPKYVTKRRRLK